MLNEDHVDCTPINKFPMQIYFGVGQEGACLVGNVCYLEHMALPGVWTKLTLSGWQKY